MRCPRCKSTRIQRGYNDDQILLRFMGLRELLCNKCGLEFKGLDPLGKMKRAARVETDRSGTHRREPRYKVHLPVTIRLVTKEGKAGRVSYSEPCWGHCESISKRGLTLSFVGSKLKEEEVSRIGQLLFVTINLPNDSVDAVVSVVRPEHSAAEYGKGKWLVGVTISNISETHKACLDAFINKCAEREPVLAID